MVINTSTGPSKVSKNGRVPGYSSDLILLPSTNSGVFVSFNTSHQGAGGSNGATPSAVAAAVYEAALQSSSTSGG